MRCRSLAMAAAFGLALRGTSLAADPRFPDWPCNQIKVPEISVAAVWAGPSIDDVGNVDLFGNRVLGNGSIVIIE
jgi:hypothetical protein